MGWIGVRNGDLLARAAAEGFDAMLTLDAGIQYEQNLTNLPCSVVIITAESNAFEHLEPHLPKMLDIIRSLKPKTLVRVD
jgi:hypothetical protein